MISAPSLAFVLWSSVVLAAPSTIIRRTNDQHISFDCKPPQHGTTLPLLSLGHQHTFPDDKFEDIVKSAAPGAALTEKKDGANRYWYDGDLLIGYFDDATGETSVFPKLGSLKPATGNINTKGISGYIGDAVPDDDTQHSIVIGSNLSGSQRNRDGDASPPATYLLESIIQRTVKYENEQYPVCGPGTEASFKFSADGSVVGLTHKWRTARNTKSNLNPLSQDTIQSNIAAQLSAANVNANVTVLSIDLCFYDSGESFIQPVYRYNATVSHPFGLGDGVILGYIPAGGNPPEPLPTLNPPSDQVVPTFSPNSTVSNSTGTNNTAPPVIYKRDGITVGRFCMRGDQYSPQMVVDENAFWSGLSSVSSSFVNSQYYWDEPFIYEDDAQYFVDNVNIAFTEGHGNVHLFCTDETLDGWGVVHIPSDLPTNGFGPGAGGSLAYWIIRACETVSTPADYSAADFNLAFDPWWSVFNGMHAVMGYHSNAAVYDNEMGSVGKVLAQGQSAVHGWLNAAKGGGSTSAVVVCGHDDDTIYQIGNVGKPGCLRIWWW